MPQIKGKQIADAQITQEKLNLVDPTSALEAATKQYVDNLADGKIDGTIAAGEVAFGTGVDSIGGDASFTWDAGANTLALTSAGPALTVSNDVDGQFVSIEASSHSMDFIDPLGSSAVALISAVNGFTAGDGGTNSTNITAGEVLVEQPGSSLSASVTPAIVTLIDNVQQISLSATAAELSIKGDSALPTVPSIAAKDADNSATTLNLSVGGLTVNGASGDAGQVLTSQGAGVAPVWADASGGIAGTIGVNQIAFGSAADTIGGDSRLTWNELSEGEVKVSSATNSVKMRAEIWPLIEASDSMNINIANFNGALGLQAGGNDLVLIGGDDGGGQSYLQSQNGVRIEARGPLVVTDYDGSHTATLYAKDSTGTASPLNISMSELQMNGASGDAGQVLTSNGAGVAPTWAAVSVPDASITQAKLNLVDPTSDLEAATKQYVDNSIGDIVLPPAGSVSKVYYVSTAGNDSTGDGSISQPYLTIQAAHDAAKAEVASTEPVQITVLPGSYTENLSIDRTRTLFVCDDRDTRTKLVSINGSVTITPAAGSGDFLQEVISFDGFGIYSSTQKTVYLTGSQPVTLVLNNCEVKNSYVDVSGPGVALSCDNSIGLTAVTRMRSTNLECVQGHCISATTGSFLTASGSILGIGGAAVAYAVVVLDNGLVNLTARQTAFVQQNNAPVFLCKGATPARIATLYYSEVLNTSSGASAECLRLETNVAATMHFCYLSKSSTTAYYVNSVSPTTASATLQSNLYAGSNPLLLTTGALTVVSVNQDAATGDLSGRYPSPSVVRIQGRTISTAVPVTNQSLIWSGTAWTPSLVGNANIGAAQVTQDKLNLTSPINPGDAATKQYVDNLTLGLSWKDAVRLIATSNVTTSGIQTIDGQSTGSSERVLLTNQLSGINNGIYVTSTSGAWSRATDFSIGESAQGAAVLVTQGSSYADTQWICTTDAPSDIIGTDALTFTQFGVGTSYTAGDGLQLLGSAFSVLAENDSITVSASGIKAATLASSTQEVAPSNTAGNASSTGIALATKPLGSGVVHVFVNGLRAYVGDASTAKEAYFSNDGGITPLAFSALDIGDILYWNGIVAGYDLANATDLVSFLYQD